MKSTLVRRVVGGERSFRDVRGIPRRYPRVSTGLFPVPFPRQIGERRENDVFARRPRKFPPAISAPRKLLGVAYARKLTEATASEPLSDSRVTHPFSLFFLLA